MSLFLPEGYPDTVSSDYLGFQVWDTLQAVSSYLRGIICTQALLVGVGVGQQGASTTSAVLQWVFRDGCGLVGSILFAWANAKRFGADIKFWRLFADYMNDLGLVLELIAPITGSQVMFTTCASLGSVCKAMCGVAAGATRAAITQHFCKDGTCVSDVATKEGIQENMVTLIGLVAGMYIAHWLDGSMKGTWIIFWALTVFHVVANYIAVTSLSLRTLNMQRIWINMDQYILHKQVFSPDQAAKKESVFGYNEYWKLRDPKLGRIRKVKIGCEFSRVPVDKEVIQNDLQSKFLNSKVAYWFIEEKGYAFIVLRSTAKSEDILQALLDIARIAAKSRRKLVSKEFIELLKEHHWKTQELFLSIGDYRCEWELEKSS